MQTSHRTPLTRKYATLSPAPDMVSSSTGILDAPVFKPVTPNTEKRPPSKVTYTSGQPSTAELAKLGIRVKDFAYEDTLPPITPYRVLQIQPGRSILKRTRGEVDEVTDSSTMRKKKKKYLERTPTEPFIEQETPTSPPRSQAFRARGFNNPRPPPRDEDMIVDTFDEHTLPEGMNLSSPPCSQPPLQYSTSQESEPYVATPTFSPHGALQYLPTINSSPIANSQPIPLHSSQPLLEPQEPVSYSQLGFPVPNEGGSESSSHAQTSSNPGPLSRLGSLSSLSSLTSSLASLTASPPAYTQSRVIIHDPSPLRLHPLSRSNSLSSRQPASTGSPRLSPRYYLRNRRPIPSPPSSKSSRRTQLKMKGGPDTSKPALRRSLRKKATTKEPDRRNR